MTKIAGLLLFFTIAITANAHTSIDDERFSGLLKDVDFGCLLYKGGRGPSGPPELERFKIPALNMLKRAKQRGNRPDYEKLYYAIQNSQFSHGSYDTCSTKIPGGENGPAMYVQPGECKIFICLSAITPFSPRPDYISLVVQMLLHEANHLTGVYGSIPKECESDRTARDVLRTAGYRIYPSGYDQLCGNYIPW
jgi:hypothetical protein